MTKGVRPFTTLPARAIADTTLTALDLRCLAVIAYHDGMSASRGSGGGCYARNDTLAAIVRTDTTNFSKCLSKLIRLEYVTREPQLTDKRRFTLRVQYPTDDSWRTDQQSDGEKVGEITNNGHEIVGQFANQAPKVVGDGESENGGFSSQTDRQYISLNEEIDFDESSEINSAKRRDVAVARRPAGIICQLPEGFNRLPYGAKVAKVEGAFNALDRDVDAIPPDELKLVTDWLLGMFDEFPDETFGQQALRLYEEISP